MSEYTLSNSAAVIDAAISSVAGADATPTAGSQNMVTSGGVKTYVDGAVGVFAGKTITTEATGIENTDNDTSIPTSAAVVDYVSSKVSLSAYGGSSVGVVSRTASTNQAPVPLTTTTLSGDITTNGTSFTLSKSGLYLVAYSVDLSTNSGSTSYAALFKFANIESVVSGTIQVTNRQVNTIKYLSAGTYSAALYTRTTFGGVTITCRNLYAHVSFLA